VGEQIRGNKDNLKVEINYSLRNHILPIVEKKVNIDFLQFDFEVKTLSTLELFGSKIKLLLNEQLPGTRYSQHVEI